MTIGAFQTSEIDMNIKYIKYYTFQLNRIEFTSWFLERSQNIWELYLAPMTPKAPEAQGKAQGKYVYYMWSPCPNKMVTKC